MNWKCWSESQWCVSHCKNVVSASVPEEKRKCVTMQSQGHLKVLFAASDITLGRMAERQC